ncbi:MAG: hypothetical protein LC105_01405 [Chitinophagales bacterium]|nr:hypothetical protein [Chitinophagales bacterium]
MYQLKFTLKQHTPIIHFQHDQVGATLRATEVKPKLDRFILMKLGNGNYERGREIAKNNGWLIDKDKGALDYKMRINPLGSQMHTELINLSEGVDRQNRPKLNSISLGGYFGNMMKVEEFQAGKPYKKVSFYETIDLTFSSGNQSLIEKIRTVKNEFFFKNNFSTRQSKGFGGFYPLNETNTIESPWYYKSFEIRADDIKQLFYKLELFYKLLRSGINLKDRNRNDLFYAKSLLFCYMKATQNIQWEKKTIKEHWFNLDRTRRDGSLVYEGLTSQIQRRRLGQNDQSGFSSQNKKVIKDILGLSSDEAWLSYSKAMITKEHVQQNGREFPDNSIEKIERYSSPILFKIIHFRNDIYNIYMIVNDSDAIKNKKIKFSYNNQSFDSTTANYQVLDFLNWICDNSNLNFSNHVSQNMHNATIQNRDIGSINLYSTLNDIINQLQS